MSRFITLFACLSLGVLPGCLPGDPVPPSVEQGYSSGAGGKTRHALVPKACMQAPDPQRIEADASLPPLGCANAYNLQKMAEQKRDLVRGRRLGDAPAAPAARAASNYLNGTGEKTPGETHNPAPNDSGPAAKPAPGEAQAKMTAAAQ